MSVLIVFDHPRRQSFCGAVLNAFVDGLTEAGHEVEIADLRAEEFDPRLELQDEPDWQNPRKVPSPAVQAEQERVERHDALVLLFPVWWWSFPATTKGWIDRVWGHGWAYGDQKLAHRKALLLAVAASDAQHYTKRGYDVAMQTQLLTGVMNYCGVQNAALEYLHGSLDSAAQRERLLGRARELGASF